MNKEMMYIFSTYQSNKTLDENMAAHLATFEYLTKRDFRPQHVAECYKDIPEESILLMGPQNEYELLVRSLASDFNQESILEIEPHNDFKSSLYYLGTKELVTLGKLKEVHPIKALNTDAYSIIGGRYYVVE